MMLGPGLNIILNIIVTVKALIVQLGKAYKYM